MAALDAATSATAQVEAGRDLVSEGERPDAAYVILQGFACRYKLVPDGGRSILAYLVPGDGCDLVGVGRRSADRQVAHIICELFARLNAVGLGLEPDYRLPLAQSELADTAGLSNVHLSRVLSDLRRAGLIESGR